jgi:hypothetical protein
VLELAAEQQGDQELKEKTLDGDPVSFVKKRPLTATETCKKLTTRS